MTVSVFELFKIGIGPSSSHTVDPALANTLVAQVRSYGQLPLAGGSPVAFRPDDDIVLHRRKRLEFHSNGMRFAALDADGGEISARTYYSVGGGPACRSAGSCWPTSWSAGTPARSTPAC